LSAFNLTGVLIVNGNEQSPGMEKERWRLPSLATGQDRQVSRGHGEKLGVKSYLVLESLADLARHI
jgi:hypothetical protein